MTNDDTPEPGSAEYDAMMAAKYRRQGQDHPLTEDGEPASSYRTVQGGGANTVQVHKGSTLGPPGPQTYSAAQADPGQIRDLERDIERVRAELAEVIRHDPATGEPVMRYTGEARRMREVQLAHWETVELPATTALVEAAQEWRAQNVETPLQKLIRERDHRDAISARADEIALEREAQEMAAKRAKSRG